MAILENWQQVSDAQEVAANSAGTSAQKYDIYLNSIQAHLNTLKTTWSEFLMNLGNSGVINTAIDALTGFVQIIDKLINNTPIMTALITALGVALANLTINKLANIGTAFINMTSGLKSATTIVSQIGLGLKTLLGIAPAAAAGTEAVGVAGFSAAGGMSALGASISTLLPALLAIAGAVAAVMIIAKVLDALTLSDKELAESIQTHKDNIDEIEKTTEGYNETLETNKQRLEEINSLKGTSSWTSELENEADTIERQNQQLEYKIQLQERLLELEQQELLNDQKEQYKREYGSEKEYVGQENGEVKRYSGTEAVAQEWKDATQYITMYKQQQQKVNDLLDKSKNATGDQKKAYDEQIKSATKQMDTYYDTAVKQEKKLTDEIDKIKETRDTFKAAADSGDKEAKEMADSLDDLLAELYQIPTTADGFDTVGEALGYTASNIEDTRSSAEILRDKFVELHNTEVKPKDADSMVDWLNGLSETDFSHVQDVLLGCGDAADVLSEALGNLSKDQSAELLTKAWKIFNGELDNATELLSDFASAKTKDWDEQASKVAEAMVSVKTWQSGDHSTVNYQEYATGLKVLGLTVDEVAEKESVLTERLKNTQKYLGTEGTERNYETFVKDIQALGDKTNEFGRRIAEVSGDADSGFSFVINDIAGLSKELGISETLAQSLLDGLQQFGEVTINPSTTLLQDNLIETRNQIEDIRKLWNESWGNGSLSLDADSLPKTREEIVEIGNQLNTVAMQRYGINFDIDTSNAKKSVEELSTEISAVTANYGKYFSESTGEINLDAVKTAIDEVNSSLDEEHKIKFDADTQSIDNLTATAVEKLNTAFGGDSGLTAMILSSLQGGLGEVDWSTGFEGLTESAQEAVESVQTNLNNIQAPETQAWAEAIVAAAQGCGEQVEQQLQAAMDKVAAINGRSAILDTIKSQSGETKSSVNAVGTALASLKSNAATVAQYVNAQLKTINIPTLPKTGGMTGFAPVGYATGGVYGAEDGKDPNGHKHLMATSNTNAMVGEAAPELLVHKDGTSELVGKQGVEFIHLDKGDTVIPANVTSLIQQGKISGYSKGASGSVSGLSDKKGIDPHDSTSSKSSSSSTKSSKSSSGSSSKSSSGSSSKSSSSSSGSSSSSSGTNEQAENELKALEHQRKMEYITEKQYAQKYEAIWKKYYKDVAEYRDKDYEMQEKLHDLQKTFFEDTISQLEEQVDMLERTSGTEQQQIAAYKKMQDLYHQRAEQYRKQGFSDDSPEIRELSKEWWTIQDQINEAQKSIFDNFIDGWEHAADIVDAKIELIPEVITQADENAAESLESLQNRLNSRLDQVMDLYKQKIAAINVQMAATQNRLNELYQQGYEKNKEQIKELEKQLLTYKKNILEIANDLKEEEISSREKEIDYQTQLKDAIKEYAQERSDAIQKEIDKLEEENDTLDKQKEKKKLLDALDSAKNRNKRVYHADTGN